MSVRSILPNFHVTIGSLDDRKTTLNILLSFDTMPCPDLHDATVLTTDILWKTSVTYKAVDYIGLKKGLKLKSENPEDKHVVLIQVTIQKRNQNDKMNSILRVPSDLTAGKAGVLFIMVKPYWQDFDEGFRVAVDKTSGAAPGTNRFKQWWYGQPTDFSSIKALLNKLYGIYKI